MIKYLFSNLYFLREYFVLTRKYNEFSVAVIFFDLIKRMKNVKIMICLLLLKKLIV